MGEFWEDSFKDNQMMWGLKPADSATETLALFQKQGFTKVLIPGFGYGRNANVFIEKGFDVTGIEISKTAVELAKNHYKGNYQLFQGSVGSMPFNDEMYDGIFCYALIHLLNQEERIKLIADCYNQLNTNGLMVFVTLATSDGRFGQGEEISKNRFLTKHGVKLFFYDSASIEKEFGEYGLIEAEEINEPVKNSGNKPSQKFWKITCRKM